MELLASIAAWLWENASASVVATVVFPIIAAGWEIYKRFWGNGKTSPPSQSITATDGGVAVNAPVGVSPGGPTVISTGSGAVSVHVGDTHGVNEETFQCYAAELGITNSALRTFFRLLQTRQVPPEELDNTLRRIAGQFVALQEALGRISSTDHAVIDLKQHAKKALENGDFDLAEKLINDACDRDIEAARQMQHVASQRLLEASASKAENGDLKLMQLAYHHAAKYYSEAVDLVPSDHPLARAWYLNRQGIALEEMDRFLEAQSAYESSLDIRVKLLAPNRWEIAESKNNVGHISFIMGDYDMAESSFNSAMEIFSSIDHPMLSACLINLASLYQVRKRYADAERILKRAAEIIEKTFGADSPDLCHCSNNLATLYRTQGRHQEAEVLHRHLLKIRTETRGLEHIDTAQSLYNLAVACQVQHKFGEAEALHKQSLTMSEKILGTDHTTVATGLTGLAALYSAQGRYTEAKPLSERALMIREKKLGSEHPLTRESQEDHMLLLGKLGSEE